MYNTNVKFKIFTKYEHWKPKMYKRERKKFLGCVCGGDT